MRNKVELEVEKSIRQMMDMSILVGVLAHTCGVLMHLSRKATSVL